MYLGLCAIHASTYQAAMSQRFSSAKRSAAKTGRADFSRTVIYVYYSLGDLRLNNRMIPQAYAIFRTLLEETYHRQGWQIPDTVIEYQTQLLAVKIDQPSWQPEPSYAERYLQLRNCREAKNLGDTCWFTRAVFPELGSRRGIAASYYVQMGQGCYSRVVAESNDPAVKLMQQHFEFLAEAAYTAIRLNREFREMWDLD